MGLDFQRKVGVLGSGQNSPNLFTRKHLDEVAETSAII